MAYREFMAYVPPILICVHFGIPITILRKYLVRDADDSKAWLAQREAIEDKEFKAIVESKREDLKQIISVSSRLIMRALHRYNENMDNVDVDEARKISEILGNAFKIYQLENSKPTEITLDQSGPEDIKKIIAELDTLDEFVDYRHKVERDGPLEN